jgi:hypothetical protein
MASCVAPTTGFDEAKLEAGKNQPRAKNAPFFLSVDAFLFVFKSKKTFFNFSLVGRLKAPVEKYKRNSSDSKNKYPTTLFSSRLTSFLYHLSAASVYLGVPLYLSASAPLLYLQAEGTFISKVHWHWALLLLLLLLLHRGRSVGRQGGG